MDNSNTIEGQSATPAGAAETIISAPATEASLASPVVDIPKLDSPNIAPSDAANSSASAKVEPLRVEPLPLDAIKPLRADYAGPAPGETAAAAAATAANDAAAPERAYRFNPLAAAVALAAAFGVLMGALGASALVWPASEAVGTPTAAAPAVQAAIEQMRTELAALRTGVEAGTRSASAQFGKITERFDRVERAQAERAAKLTKAVDAVERLERRADLAPAKETTGSVTPQPAAAAPAQPPQPSIVPGWTVRDVYRGVAIIQGARLGPIEVEAGDTVPYLGRIEAIRRQDGHWVVVTSKGIIASAR